MYDIPEIRHLDRANAHGYGSTTSDGIQIHSLWIETIEL